MKYTVQNILNQFRNKIIIPIAEALAKSEKYKSLMALGSLILILIFFDVVEYAFEKYFFGDSFVHLIDLLVLSIAAWVAIEIVITCRNYHDEEKEYGPAIDLLNEDFDSISQEINELVVKIQNNDINMQGKLDELGQDIQAARGMLQ